MLTKSFIHIKGVGTKRERFLWKRGATSWDAVLASKKICDIPSSITHSIRKKVTESVSALECHDGAFFDACMPACEIWRLYPEFADKTVFLDIETTGLSPEFCDITIISLFSQEGARALVRGKDLDEFPRIISKYSLLVTYNGKCFDLPFLHAHFPQFQKSYAHIDLRYPLHRLGLSGGLKGVERKVGIHREGALSLVDGLMAISLWNKHKQGNKTALDTLCRYALEDVVNLQPLMELAYNRSIAKMPIAVNEIKPGPLPQIAIPYDEKLIQGLAQARILEFGSYA